MSRARIEALFRLHGEDVLAYALRRTDRATAEDVVADVFVVAFRHPGRVPEREPILWLYGVARRLLANQHRAARRRASLADALIAVAAIGEAQPEREVDGELLRALAALSPADREVLLLTAWEGLDGAQAAAVLGCSVGAVHTRLHRARARLQALLSEPETAARPAVAPEVPCHD